MSPAAWLWLAVALPLVGGLGVRLAPRRLMAPVAAGAAAITLLPASALVALAARGETAASGGRWLGSAGLEVGLRLDGLSAAMAGIVALTGAVVVVYATGYFEEHPRGRSALAGLLAFVAAMQALVLADGFLMLLIAWEIVGALSARLIAFGRERPDAPAGAVRAFLTTRAADTGLYLAVFALWAATGSLAFTADRPDGALGALVASGLLLAAIGKSAQVPLQSWLAGAMAGPTPVSALLHSATMVAAGVYLLARNEALLAGWPLELAGWIGASTAVLGALIALGERDLKRVLAGSTSSQLGLMLVGVAAGGPAVAVFHLAAHAAGKATMFLAAGAFQHARGSTDLEDLRGVARAQPAAFAAFALGAASIAAVPPLAAFWSKDAIVAAAETNPAWLVLVLLAGAGSAAYLLRPALVLADRGAITVGGSRAGAGAERGARQAGAGAERREGQGADAAPVQRRVPPVMVGAAAVLAGAGVLLGALGAPLAGLLGAPAPETTLVSVAGSLLALVAGAVVVRRPRALAALGHAGTAVGAGLLRGADAAGGAVRLGARGVAAVDERVAVRLPDALARGAAALSRGVDRADRGGLDAAVDGVGRGGLLAASASDRVERGGIDAAVDGLARAVGRGGRGASAAQTGKLHEYLRDAVLGAAAIALLIALTAIT